ncbi:MAG: hypothetical protein V7K92_08550 [Nostoc sp.]
MRSFYKVPGAIYQIAAEATSSVTMIALPPWQTVTIPERERAIAFIKFLEEKLHQGAIAFHKFLESKLHP